MKVKVQHVMAEMGGGLQVPSGVVCTNYEKRVEELHAAGWSYTDAFAQARKEREERADVAH